MRPSVSRVTLTQVATAALFFFTLVDFTMTYNIEVCGNREMLACIDVIHVGLLKFT